MDLAICDVLILNRVDTTFVIADCYVVLATLTGCFVE